MTEIYLEDHLAMGRAQTRETKNFLTIYLHRELANAPKLKLVTFDLISQNENTARLKMVIPLKQ